MKPVIIPQPKQIINLKGEREKAKALNTQAWLLEVVALDVDKNTILLRTISGDHRRIFCKNNQGLHPCHLDLILQDFEITPKNK